MRIAYLDESGSPELSDTQTSHFVLLALTIEGETWKAKDRDVSRIKEAYSLTEAEIHAGWMARAYPEQESIRGFAGLNHKDRRTAVSRARETMLLRRATLRGVESARQLKKNLQKTEPYIHLTYNERRETLRQLVNLINTWDDCRIFAECTDKRAFTTTPRTPPFEEAFEQVVTRIHRFLAAQTPRQFGLLVQDHNQTVAERLTQLMRSYHHKGTRWIREIPLIVDTPLFVDSCLTSLVQAADVCAYATRRYLDNNERDLFERFLPRGSRTTDGRLVGLRHYRGTRPCACLICQAH